MQGGTNNSEPSHKELHGEETTLEKAGHDNGFQSPMSPPHPALNATATPSPPQAAACDQPFIRQGTPLQTTSNNISAVSDGTTPIIRLRHQPSSVSTSLPKNISRDIIQPLLATLVEMEQLPLADAAQRASHKRYISTILGQGALVPSAASASLSTAQRKPFGTVPPTQQSSNSALPPAAAAILDALQALNKVLLDDIFESPLPASQAPRSFRVGILTAARDTLATIRRYKSAIEDALNAINEFVDKDEDIALGLDSEKEREMEGVSKIKHKEKNATSDDDEEIKSGDDELRQQAADRIRDAIYDLCDQLYTDLVMPRIAVGEALLGAKTALSLRSREYMGHASDAIHNTFKITSKDFAKALCYGPLLLNKYQEAGGGQQGDGLVDALPLSWITNDLLDEAEEEMVRVQKDREDTESNEVDALKEKDSTDRKALIACRLAVQEIPEHTRSLLDSVAIFVKLFRVVEDEGGPLSSRASSPLGSHNTSITADDTSKAKVDAQRAKVDAALDDICDTLLHYGVVDAEMWMTDYVKTARRRQEQQNNSNSSGMADSQRGNLSRTASALRSTTQRTMSFNNGNASPSSNEASLTSGLPRTISGTFSTPRKKAMLLSASKKGGDDALEISEGDDEELNMSNPHRTKGGNPALRSTSFILNGSSSEAGVLESSLNSPQGNTFEALINKLDAIMATPSPQTTAESLAITSRLYDVLGRINLLLRRAGMAKDTKTTTEGKVVPTAADDVKVYLEHQLDEVQGFGRRESVLYEHACLCFENWSKQNKVRMELDGLMNMPDDEFYRACDSQDMLSHLFADADRYCVVTETREAVTKRMDKLLIIRIKVYHHSGEVRVLTIPQRTTLQGLIDQKLLAFFPDARACEVCFLDDGDKVRISSDEEFADLVKMRRAVAIEGMGSGLGSTSILGSSQVLGRSQMSKSLMSSSELKLELYLDPIQNKGVAALGGRVSSALARRDSPPTGARNINTPSPTRSKPSESSPYTQANMGSKASPGAQGNNRLGLNELIRQQEAEDIKRLEALGIDWSKVSLGASATSKDANRQTKPTAHRPAGVSSLGAHQVNTVGGTFDLNTIGTADLTAFFDRKMAEKGLALAPSPERSKVGAGYATINTTTSSPSAPIVPQYRPTAPSVNTTQQPSPPSTSALTNGPAPNQHATRALFLAMGRARKEAGGTNEPHHHNGGIDSDLGTHKPMPKSTSNESTPTGGDGIVLTETARAHSGGGASQPTGSVVLVNTQRGRWQVSSNTTGYSLANNTSAGAGNAHQGASIVIADTNDSADEDEMDELIGHPTWRGRGMSSADHIAAVMNSNGGSNGNGSIRYNGPLRRGGVPLPQQARRGR